MGLLFSPYSISLLLPKNVKLVVFLTLKKLCSFRLFCYSTLHTLVNLTDSISINEMVDWNLLGTFIFLFTMLSLFFKCPLTEQKWKEEKFHSDATASRLFFQVMYLFFIPDYALLHNTVSKFKQVSRTVELRFAFNQINFSLFIFQ